MDIEAYTSLVTGYYLFNSMPDNVVSDWDRYIVTDGLTCSEVDSQYVPKPNEMVFYCTIQFGRTEVVLHRSSAEQ